MFNSFCGCIMCSGPSSLFSESSVPGQWQGGGGAEKIGHKHHYWDWTLFHPITQLCSHISGPLSHQDTPIYRDYTCMRMISNNFIVFCLF